jgi:minor curlin subunit
VGVIHQEGNGHNGSLAQGGGGNAGGVFQFGENTNAHLGQTGGQGDLVFVFGW